MADDGHLPGQAVSVARHSMRSHRIAALERRIATQEGDVRQLLQARLDALVAGGPGDTRLAVDQATFADTAKPATPGPLDELAASIANRSPSTTYPELEALDGFRSLWSRLRADSQLRQSLQQDTEDSGPLNSGRLAHRALLLMRECSPGYTQHFLSYVDALSWMEQFDSSGASGTADATRHAGTKPRTKRKPRKRGD